MNERIRLLAEQARLGRGPEKIHISENGVVIFYLDELEKFAELVVGECMACSTWVGRVNKYAIEPVHTAHTINQRIKEHFGVEE